MKPVETVIIQEEGGTVKAVSKGIKLASKMVQDMSQETKQVCNISDLIVALECGGSDPTSGIAANPAMGVASDIVIENGGTVILSETTEFIGAEHLLKERAINDTVGNQILNIVRNIEETVMDGQQFKEEILHPEIAGGYQQLRRNHLDVFIKVELLKL